MTDDDEGKAIQVRVTFTDDEGNDELLTSNAMLSTPLLVIPDEDETPESSEAKGEQDTTVRQETNAIEMVMASNLGEAEAGRYQRTQIGLDTGQAYAQSFTTGSTPVTLEKVRLHARGDRDDEQVSRSVVVSIRANSPVPGQPGRTLHLLTTPFIDGYIATYEDFASDGFLLDANTTYWLVVHRPWGTDYFGFSATISENGCLGRVWRILSGYYGELFIFGPPEVTTPPENAFTGEPGWSLGDYFFHGLGSQWIESDCWSMRVAL